MGFLWRAKGFLDDLLGNSKYLSKKEDKPSELSVWNKFIYEVCDKDLNELSGIQKAALCFRYDAEMQSGGYSSFFDCCPDIAPEELIAAINLIGNKKIADNFRKALKEKALYDTKEEADDDYDDTDDDGYETVDNEYYEFEPPLDKLLMKFVEKNKDDIFGGNA